MLPDMLDLASLRALYAAGSLMLSSMVDAIIDRMLSSQDPSIFITKVDREGLRRRPKPCCRPALIRTRCGYGACPSR